MKIAKPIFTIGLPHREDQEFLEELNDSLGEKFEDYHVLVYSHPGEDLKLDCFYEKDFNEVKYNELKAFIKGKQ